MKDWKYILYITVAVGLFAGIKMVSPKQYNWNITYSHTDKNPYGAYALNYLLPSVFSAKINHSYETLYEIKDSLKREGNILIICNRFNCASADADALLNFVHKGGSALISAQYFSGHLPDTLKFKSNDQLFQHRDFINRRDTSSLRFVAPTLDTAGRYYYRRDNVHMYFGNFDTTNTTVLARNEMDNPVTIKVKWGKGNLILNSTPLAFTNIYLLADDNNQFVSNTLSYLPEGDLEWSEYYHFGRRDIRSPLRFILTTEPLRWAYYLTIITLLVFMIFEKKRRQRIIPVIKPLENTTLDFVSTIGNLYYQNNERKNIAEKRILFLFEQIRTKYWMSTSKVDAMFIDALSKKSGCPADQLSKLFKSIGEVRSQKEISQDQLIEFNTLIEKCNL